MKLVKFLPNRVWRVYLGGACIDQLRNAAAPKDDFFPEEWIASTVPAINPQHEIPGAGISQALLPDGSSMPLDRLLEKYHDEMLGPNHPAKAGNTPGFLTKLLDSAIRLPIQAHPDVPTSMRLFNSTYGKTEAWIVLAGRKINGEAPYLLMGFNDKFDWDVFYEESMTGKMVKSLEMMHRYPIVPGEVILIPGGFPHAIGSGVLVQEIMEPSDWVIQPEDRCGDLPLTYEARFNGLTADKAMEVFHHEKLTMEQLRAKVLQTPVILETSPDATVTRLIDREKIKFFGSVELKLHGTWTRPASLATFMAGTMLEGTATIKDGNETITVTAGDTFAVGAAATPVFTGTARMLLAQPPIA